MNPVIAAAFQFRASIYQFQNRLMNFRLIY
jgi:hypothetical protein